MSDVTQNLISMMEERIEALKGKGDWVGAETTAQTTVSTAKDNYELDPSTVNEYVAALEIQGNLYRDKGDQLTALSVYENVVKLLKDVPETNNKKGLISANIAIIHEDQGQYDDAKNSYKWSLHYLESANPPAWVDMAVVLNNLAFLYEAENRFEEAEKIFLKALKINNDQLGASDASTADIWNNLGGLHYKSKNLPQALEMHKMALDLRLENLGDKHIDTAQSYGNLAIVHAEMGDLDAAKGCFDSALTILEKSSDAQINDYATINANFVHILKELGHKKEAEGIEKRVSKFVKKHLG